jgi:Prealbumin-like fold domain
MGVEDLNPDECEVAPAAAGYEFSLTGYFGGPGLWTLADTTFENDTYTWSGLQLGTYNLTETALPAGYTTYFIPGSAAVGGSPDAGHEITIDDSSPSITIDVYNVGLEGVS